MTPQATLPVTLHVPEYLVLEFQAGAAGLLEELMAGAAGGSVHTDDTWPATASAVRDRKLWGAEVPRWGSAEDDLDRAAWVLKHSTKRTLQLIAALVRNAGKATTGDELGEHANYEYGARSVAPALGALGLRCRQVNRWAIWGWRAGETDEDASTYEISEEAAGLFSEALDRVQPNWREEG